MTLDVLKKDFSVFGFRFIEASAGTGKTFAIEHLFVRHLLEAPIELQEILVITFTNAGVGDLKTRIRKNLETALSDLELNVKRLDYLNGEEKEKAAKIRRALLNFEKASIFTIHGFCLKMLREKTVGFSQVEQDDDVFERILDKVDLFFKEKLSFPKYSPYFVEKLFSKDVGLLKNRILEELEKKQQKSPSFKEHFENFLEVLNSFSLPFASASILEDFELLKPNFKKLKDKDPFSSLERFLKVLESKTLSIEEFEKLAIEGLSFIPFLDSGNLKARKKVAQEKLEFFNSLSPFYSIIRKSGSLEGLFSFLAYEACSFLKEELKREALLTPNMILSDMLALLLGDPCFLESVKKSFKAVIVDEFQDTDRTQFEIFKILFFQNSGLTSFYLVGDPKQSIYGFRNADLYTYMEAKSFLDPKFHFRLENNYRSSPELIKSLNYLFSRRAWLKLPKLSLNVESLPVKAALELAPLSNEKKGLHFLILEKRKQSEREDLLFSYVAAEVRKLKIGLKIAILVKDRYEASRLKEFLNSKGIFPSTFATRNFSRKTLLSFYDLLLAVAHPEDLSNVKKVLLTPFFSLKLKEVEAFCLLASLAFFKLKTTLDQYGPSVFFRSFLDLRLAEEAYSVYENLALKENEDFLEEFNFLLANIFEKSAIETFNSLTLLAFFEKGVAKNRFKLDSLHGEDSLEIMTIHRSKGLEFDIVFALGVASESDNKDEEREAEKLRLFYVALTRAKRRLYVPVVLKEKFNSKEASSIDLFFGGALNAHEEIKKMKDENLVSVEELLAPSSMPFVQEQEIKIVKPKKEFLKPSSFPPLLSFSNLQQKENAFYEGGELLFPSGKEVGNVLHSIMATIFKGDFKKNYHFLASIVEEKCSFSPLAGFEKEVLSVVDKALFTPLLDFCLFDLDPVLIRAEEEFWYSEQNGALVKGYIDLFFCHKNHYYILDWKSNLLPGYGKRDMQKTMEDSGYFLQGAIYGRAIQKFMKEGPEKLAFGGLFFFFLRSLSFERKDGEGVYHFFPDDKLAVEALCREF